MGNHLDVEKLARKIDNLERRIAKIESTYNYVNKFGPSEERNACMAVSLKKWKEILGVYGNLKSPNVVTLSFLHQMTLKCEEGWLIRPTLLQAQWALSLIDSFDNRPAKQAKDRRISFLKNIVIQWKKCTTRIKSKKKAQDAAYRVPMDVLEDIKRSDEDTGYVG